MICFSLLEEVSRAGYYVIPETCVPGSTTQLAVNTVSETLSISNINTLFISLFDFDPTLFNQITIYLLMSFAAGATLAAIKKYVLAT